MRISWLTWFWPITILLLSASASLITFVPTLNHASLVTQIRPAIIIPFLLICPGMAIAPLLRLNEPAIELMIGIALSFTIDSFIAGILLYTGHWSIIHILTLLLGLSLAGAILQLIIASFPWLKFPREKRIHKTSSVQLKI